MNINFYQFLKEKNIPLNNKAQGYKIKSISLVMDMRDQGTVVNGIVKHILIF